MFGSHRSRDRICAGDPRHQIDAASGRRSLAGAFAGAFSLPFGKGALLKPNAFTSRDLERAVPGEGRRALFEVRGKPFFYFGAVETEKLHGERSIEGWPRLP